MPPRKKKRSARKTAVKKSNKENPFLPGYLMIAFGFLALPLNFGLVPGFEWLKAWPLLLVLFGVAVVTRELLAKGKF